VRVVIVVIVVVVVADRNFLYNAFVCVCQNKKNKREQENEKKAFTKFKNFRLQKIQKKREQSTWKRRAEDLFLVVVPTLSLLTFLNARAF
jgi:hypothetical protein